MNIKILSSLKNLPKDRTNLLIIGTHNGKFHSDDVLACAILCALSSNMSIWILRTRDSEMLAQCDICVDIGGGKFDHHQAGFNKTRENGIKYASAGLIWKAYGKNFINLLLKKYFPETNCDTDSIFEAFDASCIALVDCEDNGIKIETHCFSFISSFLPWFSNNLDDFNKQFHQVLLTTIAVLEQQLKTAIAKEIAKDIILSNWNNVNYFHDGILEIPSQTMFWEEAVIHINASTKVNKINFVIFPYSDGGWAAQCVSPSLKNGFKQRIPFPIEWAGQTEKLAEISGVKGATLCHNGRFFVRATTKEAVVQMCNIAANSRKWRNFLLLFLQRLFFVKTTKHV